MRASATLRAIEEGSAQFALPRSLITTDRILQRWAVSTGDGLPSEEWDDTPKAKPPPLPDDIAILVDQCVLKSTVRTQKFIIAWYKTPEPVEVICSRVGVRRTSGYDLWGVVLELMKWRFLGTGDIGLVRLVERL